MIDIYLSIFNKVEEQSAAEDLLKGGKEGGMEGQAANRLAGNWWFGGSRKSSMGLEVGGGARWGDEDLRGVCRLRSLKGKRWKKRRTQDRTGQDPGEAKRASERARLRKSELEATF